MLRIWLKAVKGATQPGMKHILYFVGDMIPNWVMLEYQSDHAFQLIQCHDKPGDLSIGHYHNLGAKFVSTEWMMKLDVDAIPNTRYFKELLPLLKAADPKEWFNGGMMYATQNASAVLLSANMMPLDASMYQMMMSNRKVYFSGTIDTPAATNFICRTKDYLALDGCDERFRGYGWEDYQQIYMLERHWLRRCPLPSPVTFENVTQRCREISRRKARELFERSPWLALLHHWHPKSSDPFYRSQSVMQHNKQVLLEYINGQRRKEENQTSQ